MLSTKKGPLSNSSTRPLGLLMQGFQFCIQIMPLFFVRKQEKGGQCEQGQRETATHIVDHLTPDFNAFRVAMILKELVTTVRAGLTNMGKIRAA